MISSVIQDGKGTKNKAKVTSDGCVLICQDPAPPLDPQKVRPFSQYLTTDGTSTGSNDMGIDGSVTNVDFYVPASTNDRYITQLSFIVGYGTSGRPYEFADNTALTNGCRLHYSSLKGEVEAGELITNLDFLRLSGIPLVPTAWEIRHVGALNDYGYVTNLNLLNIVPPFGIRLDATSSQKLVLTVRDDCTNADTFNIFANGFERFE